MAIVRDSRGVYESTEESTERVSKDGKEVLTEPPTETGSEAATETGSEAATETDAEPSTETGSEAATETGAEPSTETYPEGQTEAKDADKEGEDEKEEDGNKKDEVEKEKDEEEEGEDDEKEDGEEVEGEDDEKEEDEEEKENEEEEEKKDEGEEITLSEGDGAGERNLEDHQDIDENEEREEDEKEDDEKEEGEEDENEEGEEDEESSEGDDEENNMEGENHQEIDDDDDDDQPVRPEMLFCPTEYNKTCKIGTRCSVSQTVEYIETNFTEEVKWFKNHPQFQHIFHMPREPNHMSQGLWMLLLRTASTKTEKECWFVVNGVPIRYSIKEHALLSGLDCGTYSKYYPTEIGDLKFVKKVFGRTKGIKVKDVEKKMKEVEENISTDRKKMKRKRSTQKKKEMSSINRLKLTVLYFLCKVVVARSKSSRNIDKFILKVVDDLKTCEEFPWGRFTFDECVKEIKHVTNSMEGFVKPLQQKTISGFIVPLEILAFECIPHFRRTFREVVPAENDCPRMCKHKFSISCLKGFPLDDLTKALGDIKDITTILEPDSHERDLLSRIIDDDVDDGIGYIDPVVDSWKQRLLVHRKKIWWKGLYELDLGSRCEDVPQVRENEPQDYW